MSSRGDRFASVIAIGNIIAAVKDFVTDLIDQLSHFMFGEIIINDYDLIEIASVFMAMNCAPFSSGYFKYGISYISNDNFSGYVPIEVISDRYKLFFHKKIPLLVKMSRTDESDDYTVSIRYPRFVMHPDSLISEMIDDHNSRRDGSRFFVEFIAKDANGRITRDYKTASSKRGKRVSDGRVVDKYVDNYNACRSEIKSEPPCLDDLVVTSEMLSVVKEMEMWSKSKDWYMARGVPWKRGLLLYGAPGTGKTTLVVAGARHVDIPIFVLDLTTMGNYDFRSAWRDVTAHAPCVVLLEDLDAVFNGRKNVRAKNSKSDDFLTWDCLLNTVSGADNAQGVFLAVTTNHPEKLDKAFATVTKSGTHVVRPGRIDRILHMKEIDLDGRMKLATKILRGFPKEAEKLARAHPDMTAAAFQEICVQRIMELYWENEEMVS